LPSAFESESDIFAVPITEAVDYETEEKEKIEHTNRLLVK